MKIINYIRNSRMATSGNFFVLLRKKLNIKTRKKELYQKAFTHSSVNLKDKEGNTINFERLEFLGDALLSTIIAEYLFKLHPQANEGELTKLRAKIVSRAQLNSIGKEMGLIQLADISSHYKTFGENIHGNLIESLIGAIFIDKGYNRTKDYVFKFMLDPYINMDELETMVLSYKSLLFEWSQKQRHKLEFKTENDRGLDPNINYTCQIYLDKKIIAKARAVSKKKAEEKAAKIAANILKPFKTNKNE